MKRFNSFPPTCFRAGRPSARCWFPAFKPTTGPRFVASVADGPHFIRFHSFFFCVVLSRFKIEILWFNISSSHNFLPPPHPHTPSQGPMYVARLCGMKALPLHHAGTSLHCTDGWLKGLLFVSWFCVWQGRRRMRWLTAVITLRRKDYLSQTFSKPSTVFLNKRRKQTNK